MFKKDKILEYIKTKKKEKFIDVTLNIDEFNEIEKNRTEFCHEVGKVLGSCKMEVKKVSDEHRLLRIEKDI